MSLDEENPLRLVVYRDSYGVESGVLQELDIEGFNGVLHTINRVLLPARESAGDILRKSSGYSMFLETMETVLKSQPDAVDLSTGAANSHYTFFVPKYVKNIEKKHPNRYETLYATKINARINISVIKLSKIFKAINYDCFKMTSNTEQR